MWWFSEQSLLNLISRYTPRRYRTCKFVIQPKWTPLLPEACRLCSQLGFKTRRNDRIWFILSQLLKVYHSLATHSYTCLSHILSAFWCLDGDINSVPDEESVLWCISFRKECNRHPVPRWKRSFSRTWLFPRECVWHGQSEFKQQVQRCLYGLSLIHISEPTRPP